MKWGTSVASTVDRLCGSASDRWGVFLNKNLVQRLKNHFHRTVTLQSHPKKLNEDIRGVSHFHQTDLRDYENINTHMLQQTATSN